MLSDAWSALQRWTRRLIPSNDINTRLRKAWTAIDRLSVIWRSDLSDRIKTQFFQATVGSIILYWCTTWTLTKRIQKKLNNNCSRMLWAVMNKSWKQQPIKQQLYGYLSPISKTIQIRPRRHAGHCWRNKYELISDVLLWTSSHGRASDGRSARTYLQQLCTNTGCSLEDQLEAMNDRDEWRGRVREIRAWCTIWWWWFFV